MQDNSSPTANGDTEQSVFGLHLAIAHQKNRIAVASFNSGDDSNGRPEQQCVTYDATQFKLNPDTSALTALNCSDFNCSKSNSASATWNKRYTANTTSGNTCGLNPTPTDYGTVWIYDLDTTTNTWALTAYLQAPTRMGSFDYRVGESLAFSPDGTWLAVGAGGNVIYRTWEVRYPSATSAPSFDHVGAVGLFHLEE